MKPLRTLLPIGALVLASPAYAQSHDHGAMAPGPEAPPESAAVPPAHQHHVIPNAAGSGHDGHADHDGPLPSRDDAPLSPVEASAPMANHDHMRMGAGRPQGTDQAPGHAAPPPVASDRAADRYWDAAAMAQAERALLESHGGMRFSQTILEVAEVRLRRGGENYRWNGSFWFGGDRNRLVLKSEGEGRFGDRVDDAEVQALYSRALDAYWNLQAGLRQDVGAGPGRTHAAFGIEGLAPYWTHIDAAAFVSEKGDLTGRIEASWDQRITQRLVLQPRAEIALSAQDVPSARLGGGLSSAELGLRLRYEFRRELAPYAGLVWERRVGRTADFARAHGDDVGGLRVAFGVRAWF